MKTRFTTTEVTALPLFFYYWNENSSQLTLKLEMQNKILEVVKSTNPLGSYI
jgi:hypothetical protein